MPTTRTKQGPDLRPRWTLEHPDAAAVAGLMRSEGVPELVAQLLVNRGIDDPAAAREHLAPDLKRLHDPFLLPGMGCATERLRAAIEHGEMILVHGDYDVDGVTGTALLVRLLEQLGAQVAWHIPNRFTDGYSFGQHSVRRAREVDARVVISVDNGTSEVEIISELAALGIDTIVTDHHEPPLGDLPPALAIVNPKLADSKYPFRELCGGAVAFKLAWALCQEVSGETRVRTDLRDFLVDAMAYVAIATVCDVVPLVDENRVLAHFGLKALEQTNNPGLKALLHVSGLGPRQLAGRRLGGDDVGFQIGPRINASGRLESAARAVELLLAQDDEQAARLARELNELNERRKVLQRELTEAALTEAARFEDPDRWPITVVAGQGWHQGVVGIVAARLVETLGRPALVLGLDGERGRGSARSIPGVSVLEIMHGGKQHMLRYGGHAQAAGCELRADAVNDLREALCARARELMAESPPPEATLRIDAEIPLQAMTEELMRQVERLEPFGEQNGKPVLLSSDVRLAEPARLVGADRSHLLLQLRQGETVRKAMAFGMGARADELAMGQPLHVVYTPRWNTFRGTTNLELTLADFRVGERP
ncbi:MAG: single-stranded-DNA-specific exonuclease RecJ [Planctomycetota bacterium]